MPRSELIPPGVFTRQMARDSGLKEWDLHRSGLITRVGSDLYARTGEPVTPVDQAVALARTCPHTWISHASAAAAWGLPIEHPAARPQLTAESASHRIRRAGVDCAVDRLGGLGVAPVGLPRHLARPGRETVRMSRPERVWLELADANSLRRAVAFGDQLVRVPRPAFEHRSAPFCSLQDLVALAAEAEALLTSGRPRGLPESEWRALGQGLANLRHYAGLIRVGSDSPPETHLRLALTGAGLPEPVLQYPVRTDGRLVALIDLAYPNARIALHYDGSPHLTAEALTRDVSRDSALVALGWVNIRADRSSHRDNFRSVVAITKAALARAA